MGSLAFTLTVAACAQLPPNEPPKAAVPLVFPLPPDEPRFVYERTLYGSTDIVPEDAASEFRRKITGEARAGQGLGKPYAVAVRKGRIFLSDSVERTISVFDVPNGRYYRIGEEDPGQLQKPLGLDVDRNGTLYVADATAKAVMVFDSDGRFLRKIGGPNHFDRLASVTAEPSGERIYVVDIGGVQSQNHRVRVFDPRSGEHLFDIGKRGKEPGEFNMPRDVAVGRNGELFVVDGGNFRVQVFDHDGKFLRSFGAVGTQYGNFSRPKEISVDPEGNVYVVDTGFGNFQIFDATGKLLLFVGTRSEQDAPARYMLPSGVYVDEDGRVYMVDQWFKKVDVFRPAKLKPGEGFLGQKALAKQAR